LLELEVIAQVSQSGQWKEGLIHMAEVAKPAKWIRHSTGCNSVQPVFVIEGALNAVSSMRCEHEDMRLHNRMEPG